jgi:predicted GNAT family N-acyltransferase
MSSDAEIGVVSWKVNKDILRGIREQVFIEEQGVPRDIEWDEHDKNATHFLVTLQGQPIGCGRRQDDGKLGRMAILAEHRGRGHGDALLQFMLHQAKTCGLRRLYAHVQQQAAGFYRQAGFHEFGEPFDEAGIAHIGMEITLDYRGFEHFISGVSYPHPFDALAVQLCDSASHCIRIMSPALDHEVFDSQALSSALSKLARKSRHTWVHILISDSRPLVKRGHQLLTLCRRMPTPVEIRKLERHPQWRGETIVIRDDSGVLYKPGDVDHEGFYEPDSRASARRHRDLFDELWQRSSTDSELRILGL